MDLQILVRQCNDVTILDLTGKAAMDASEGELLSKRLRFDRQRQAQTAGQPSKPNPDR